MNHLINGLTHLSTHAALPVEPKYGQLIKGKVTQSLQENKVVVNIGKKSVQAIVNQPLIKGSSYLFQVKQVNPALVLRPVSLSENHPGQMDLSSLLKQLGVKENRKNRSLLKQMVDLNVPLHKNDLAKVFRWIQSSENQQLARDLSLYMLSRKMPIQPSVFSALITKYTSQYSQVLSEVEQQLGGKTISASDEKIRGMVHALRAEQKPNAENSTLTKLRSELANGSKMTFDLFKKAEIIENKLSYSAFKQNWVRQNPSLEQFPFTKERVARSLQQLLQHQLPLSSSESQTVTQWARSSEKLLSLWNQQPSNFDFPMLSQQTRKQWTATFKKVMDQKIMERLTPHLQESTEVFMNKAVTQLKQSSSERYPFTKSEFKSFLSDIQHVLGKQMSVDQQKLLVQSLQSLSQSIQLSDHDRMWLQMKAMMNGVGFNDEHLLAKASQHPDAVASSESSLKTLLLMGLTEGSEVKAETAHRLIHLINGTQLASHSENPQTLQIALQFPGDFIGALKDVHMNMEGRKNDEGQIDSDYCHVMFYLHLAQLEETIIDLTIVERRVSVVVYNENPEVEMLFKPHQEKLEVGLKMAGYELNSIQARTTGPVSKTFESKKAVEEEEGLDIRI